MSYDQIGWQNKPSTATPINATNLNHMDAGIAANDAAIGTLNTAVQGKVDKVEGKGLSTNDFTDTDALKLAGIEDGAEVNVQADWDEADNTADNYIKNKPDLGVYAEKDSLWQDATATGNPVTIKTQSAQAAKQTILTMTPIQSGSGTPAPDNVRPISGRTQAEIVVKDSDDVTQSTVIISLGQTVYGGTLDVETGELTIDTMCKVFDGTEDIAVVGTGANMFFRFVSDVNFRSVSSNRYGCSHFENNEIITSNTLLGCYAYYSSGQAQSYIQFRVNIEGVTNATTFKAWLTTQYNNGSPVQVFSKLATPTTATLTAAQVNLIKGINNISTDADGISLTYFADGESLTDADNRITAVLGDFATVEGARASQNYSVGDYLIFSDKFCKASAAIASGEALAIGTNLTQTTIGAELKAILAQL